MNDAPRRFGAVDRRVLDDPPVVLLRLYRVYNSGTDKEWSVELHDYDDIALSGLICMVELFEVVPDPVASPSSVSHSAQHMFNTNPNCTSPGRSVAATLTAEQKFSGDVLVEANAQTVSEEFNRTQFLFGTKFVEPHKIAFAADGRKYILFTFNDLGVKLEGCFILRYRFFDLFSEPAGGASPKIQAECYGGAFRIYSTKEAPALKESTVLTMCLAKHGVRVNVRTKARKSRKKSDFDITQTADL
ncbi:velvet factor [Mycena galericulata]|nr:velvet factor [Mycena galericulata]